METKAKLINPKGTGRNQKSSIKEIKSKTAKGSIEMTKIADNQMVAFEVVKECESWVTPGKKLKPAPANQEPNLGEARYGLVKHLIKSGELKLKQRGDVSAQVIAAVEKQKGE